MILRLNKVFHPEVLLNKRGPDWDRKLYKFWMAHCRFVSEGQFEVTDKNMLKHIAEDPNFGPNLSLWKKFIESKAKTYHFSKSLFETLLDVDSALPVKALPEKFIGYLSFPDGMMVDSDGVAYQGAYVWIDEAEQLPIHTEGHKKALMINLVPEDINGGDLSLRCPIPDVDSIGAGKDGKYVTIETIGTTVPVDTGPMARMPADGGKSWHRLEVEVIKCVLFLNSDEPDLTALKPLGNQSRTSAKKSGHNFSETSTVPITLVGWNWVRTAPEYRTEMWYRKAHFSTRWTGPGRTVLKPVFVKESWPRRQLDDNGAPNPGDEDFGSDPNEDPDEILEQDEEIAASMRDE